MGRSWGLLGRTWAVLGALFRSLGSLLGGLGASWWVLLSLGPLLGRTWVALGSLLAALGPLLGGLRVHLEPLGSLLGGHWRCWKPKVHFMKKCAWLEREQQNGDLGGLLAALGSLFGGLGWLLAALGSLRGRSWQLLARPAGFTRDLQGAGVAAVKRC